MPRARREAGTGPCARETRSADIERRCDMTLYAWLELGHILAATAWLGGGAMLTVLAARARASDDPGVARDFARLLAYTGPRLLMPSVVVLLGLGIWMVLASSAWSFGQAWIVAALGLFALSFAVGAVYLSRVALQMTHAADAASLRASIARWLLGYAFVLLLLAVAAWDMVVKPGL